MSKQILRLVFAAALVSLAFSTHASTCASGTSVFVDVPDSASFCTNTQWLRNRAVTVGCTDTTHYCPNDGVTRASMALFMNRLGVALTPTVIFAEKTVLPFDPTTPEVVCQTADVTISDFPRTLMLNSSISLQVSGYARMLSVIVISYDSGATWASIPSATTSVAHRNQGSVALDWMDIPNGATVDIDVGQTFRLGIDTKRDNLTTNPVGTGTVVDGRCKLNGLMFNRNPATAPF